MVLETAGGAVVRDFAFLVVVKGRKKDPRKEGQKANQRKEFSFTIVHGALFGSLKKAVINKCIFPFPPAGGKHKGSHKTSDFPPAPGWRKILNTRGNL